MGSTFTTFPEKYDQTSIFGTKRKLPVYVQWVPGIVVKVATSTDSIASERNLHKMGSIVAKPHFDDKGINKISVVSGEEFRYYPLLRGWQDVPAPGDPVILCTLGGVQYYLGPLNTEGLPNYNVDKYKDAKIDSPIQNDLSSLETPLFVHKPIQRLQKLLNPKLDHFEGKYKDDAENISIETDVIPGDMVFEGRHGNSIRIGSRDINPYIVISNARPGYSPMETSLDGTIIGIFNRGSIREHFGIDLGDEGVSTEEGTEFYKFKFADYEASLKLYPDPLDPTDEHKRQNILKSYNHYLGRGGAAQEGIEFNGAGDPWNVENEVYNYDKDQLFISSDRLTFNARKESIFLSAFEHIHIGSGNSMTFSTCKNIFTQAAESVITKTGLFKVSAGTVIINGSLTVDPDDPNKKIPSILLGNPEKPPKGPGDVMHKAVLGMPLLTQLSLLVFEIQKLAYATSAAIEGRASVGDSAKKMSAIVSSLDELMGTELDVTIAKPVPKNWVDIVLSDSVEIKK